MTEQDELELARRLLALLYATALREPDSWLRGYVLGATTRFLSDDQRAVAHSRIG